MRAYGRHSRTIRGWSLMPSSSRITCRPWVLTTNRPLPTTHRVMENQRELSKLPHPKVNQQSLLCLGGSSGGLLYPPTWTQQWLGFHPFFLMHGIQCRMPMTRLLEGRGDQPFGNWLDNLVTKGGFITSMLRFIWTIGSTAALWITIITILSLWYFQKFQIYFSPLWFTDAQILYFLWFIPVSCYVPRFT